MNRQVPIDRNESNPMLLGCMELVKEDAMALQQRQQELTQAMTENPEISVLMEQHKKERIELQASQQKKINDMMKENPEIVALMEQHKKEQLELQKQQRQAVEELMSKDEDIAEAMKQQRGEVNQLRLKQQKELNQELTGNQAMAPYRNSVDEARQAMQDNQQLFENEMLKAIYMTPVLITPEPEKDEEGNVKLQPGTKISVQVLPMQNNKSMMMAFTDSKEFKKWAMADQSHTVSMGMREFISTVMKDPNLAGVTINPFSNNLIIPRERMEMMMKMNAGQRPGNQGKNIKVVEADINE